jgi:acyl dehydratase
MFAGLTWDFYPLHTDEEYAKTTSFGRRIASGPFVFAISIGLMPIEFFGDAILGFLGVENLRHVAPVFPGNTLEVNAKVTEARLTSSGQGGVVTIEYVTSNEKEERVLEMSARFLMRRDHNDQIGQPQ